MLATVSALSPLQAVARSISTAKRLLAVSHVNPDGDAVGSLVALAHIAASLHIDVRLYCETPIPPHLNWLHSPAPILSSLDLLGAWQPDRVVFLDCADANRAGKAAHDYGTRHRDATGLQTICIDHHIANPHFADINWVDPGISATGAMVALLAKECGIPLSGDLGEALYLALVADTGSFSFSNTTALALDLAAEIVRNGLSMADFTVKYENHWTLNRMHLWGELMRDVKLLCGGKIVVSIVTRAILERYKAPTADLEGYAAWLRRLAEAKVVLVARPSRNGSKISLRSMGDVDVQQIAAEFDGGGHRYERSAPRCRRKSSGRRVPRAGRDVLRRGNGHAVTAN